MRTLYTFLTGIFFLMPLGQALAMDGTIDPIYRYAWTENVGWIDFGTSYGQVRVTDSALSGYAWGENIGWISLNCSNTNSCATVDYKVTNNSNGTLGGYAWSENVGWIQFAPSNGGVSINSSGIFSGYAWGENIGWIVFNCSDQNTCGTVDYKVSTDWRPANSRAADSTSSTHNLSGGGGRRTVSTGSLAGRNRRKNNPSVADGPLNYSSPRGLSFRDVPSNAWFATAVSRLVQYEIVAGYKDDQGNPLNIFGPGDPVTVGQIIKIALLAAGHRIPSLSMTAANPTATDWSASYIALAESLHLDLATHNVHRNATRSEAVATLLQSFGIPTDAHVQTPFSDVPQDHPHAADIATAYALGLVSGDDNTTIFRPNDLLNRAEAAKIVVYLMDASP